MRKKTKVRTVSLNSSQLSEESTNKSRDLGVTAADMFDGHPQKEFTEFFSTNKFECAIRHTPTVKLN